MIKSVETLMKILFVAFPFSVHTVRWVSQIANEEWDIYMFPSIDSNEVHPDLPKNIKICIPFVFKNKKNKIYNYLVDKCKIVLKKIDASYHEQRLVKYIQRIKPDIIHTLETQSAGYLLSEVKRKYFKQQKFPIWWHTNWGSDIYLFGRLREHKERISSVLSNCDFYSCECRRDAELAKNFSFTKTILPIYPNTGGFDIDQMMKIRSKLIPVSRRKCIMLKGYQGWAGRSLVAIRALSMLKDKIKEYTLIVFSCQGEDVKIALELLHNEAGVDVKIVEEKTEHLKILEYHGMSRVSIGLSISDSISTSVLEAMAMGSFPVQSSTSAADEWFVNGVSGFIVPPEDPCSVADAIQKALEDDELVESAEKANWHTICTRLEYNEIKQKTINSYKNIYSTGVKR